MKKIIINLTNIDDLFIYKHKIEAEIAKTNNVQITHMKIDEFINYLNIYNQTYYCTSTKESIAFSIINIENEDICFCTQASEKTITLFDNIMNEIGWDVKKLKMTKTQDIYEDIDNVDFFVINKNIYIMTNESH